MNQFEKFKEEVAEIQAAIFNPINSLITEADDDAQKYYGKGVRSAGNRLKKKIQEIRKSIKHPEVKAKMTAIQNSAKNLRESLIEESKTK